MEAFTNIIFNIAGAQVSLLELICTMSGLVCVFLAGRAKVANFWVGYVYNILLFLLFLDKHLYSSMLLQPISFVINFLGHWRWTHPKEGEANGEQRLKITTMPRKECIIGIAVIVVCALGWGAVLGNLGRLWPGTFPPAESPYLDAFTTIMIFGAQYLSAQKHIECWIVWIIVDVAQIALYLSAGLIFMPAVSAIYLILAVMGLKEWRKQLKTQE